MGLGLRIRVGVFFVVSDLGSKNFSKIKRADPHKSAQTGVS